MKQNNKHKKESRFDEGIHISIVICIVLLVIDLFLIAGYCVLEGMRTHNAYYYIYPVILCVIVWLMGDRFE